MDSQTDVSVHRRTSPVISSYHAAPGTFWGQFPLLQYDLNRTDLEIGRKLDRQSFRIREGLQGFVRGGGKRLRPALVVIGARMAAAVNGGIEDEQKETPDSAIRLAAGVELLHAATLIHDDILDQASHRRGRIALHKQYGVHDAVLMGDFLFSLTFELFADHASPRQARILARGVSRMCESELRNAEAPALTRREYMRRIFGKTTALFMLSLVLGASEHGASEQLLQRLRRIGYCLGTAFQIQDDVLDVSGDPSVTGKPVGGDLLAGTVTLPLIEAAAGPTELAAWHRSVESAPKRSRRQIVQTILADVRVRGGVDAATQQAGVYLDRAKAEFAGLPAGMSADALRSILDHLERRQS
ncbi:MAG: polyprenyl synthetase family protein [Spirochaetota bacterium]